MEGHIDGRTREGRAARADAVGEQRRRRKGGTLNRMAQLKLDCIEPEDLDLAHYVYRWVNDEGPRMRQLTRQDDYDHVNLTELGDGFDPEATDSEGTAGHIRMLVGTQKSGAPLYAYLLKKRRDWWTDDNEEMVRSREDMMAGRVYGGEADEDESRPGGDDKFYVPGGVKLGGSAQRRRGPITRS